jgi:iron complex outermembrane receptor protein
MDLRLLSSRQRGKTEDQTDGDRTATAMPQPPNTNVGRVAYARTGFKTWLHEANLLSTGEGPVQWVLGAFYMHEGIPVYLLRDNRNTTDFVQSNSTIITHAENETKSAFGQINAFVSDRMELIGGARYSKDTQYYNRIALPGAPLPPGTDRIGPPAASSEWTGKLGANLHASNDLMYYATISRGYKAGGVNLTLNTPNFRPEKNLVYELGAKSTLPGRRLRLNASAFYSDYQDIQLSSLFNALPLTQNAASGRAIGGELELTGRFGPWNLNAGLGVLNAEFAEDATIVNTVTNTQQVVPKGADLPFSPEITFNAGVSYGLVFGESTLTPRLQWSHTGRQLATPFPSVVSIVPARNIVDARVTLDGGGAWMLEAFATNLLDKTYIASQIQNSTSATGGIIYGAPRQFGLRASVQFGN